MKKLFLLIPALVLSLVTNAAVINITPTSPKSSDNLRRALNDAADGDIIEMAEGLYVESNSNYIAFTGKNITVRAAAGAEVILQPKVSIRLKESARAEFIGIKIDCGHLSDLSSYSNLMVSADNTDGKKLILTDCELYGWAQNGAIIRTPSSNKMDSIIINNCYFHDCYKSVLYCEDPNLIGVEINNSTFANVNGTYWAAPIYVPATSGKLVVDHCTFYNVEQADAGSGVVTTTLADATVSNCIFMFPTSGDICATKLPAGGVVKNTLTYNYDNWQPYGHYNTATLTDCVKANPLFKDAANGKFSLYASSPARGAGLASSDLGDPRWHKALAPVAIPATLVPFDALLSAKASIIQSDPDSIFLKTESKTVIEWAKWNISVAESGLYDFTAYAKRTGSSGSQKLQILVLNSAENDTLKDKAETGLPNECTLSSGAVNLEAGNTYVIKVLNNYDWAESKLIKVVAAYAGGKTIAIPDTLKPIDAIKSERAYVNEDGELRFTDDSHDGYVREQWGKWNINVADAGKYKFTANVNSANGQNYRITLKSADESSTIGTWYGEGNSSGERKISTELVDLTSSNYVLVIEDTVNYSHGRVVNIVASYEGGKTVNVPGQIIGKYAVIYDNGHKRMSHKANGDLEYGNNSTPSGEYAYWNIYATEAGEMAVELNVDPSQSGGHNYRIELYDGNELKDYSQELDSDDPSAAVHEKGNLPLSKSLVIPAAGTYTLRVLNRTLWSTSILHGITFAPYVAPAGVTMTDTDTDNSAWIAEKNNTVNVTVNRTILGGMYNTICLPFKVSSNKCKEIFGNDVELYTLGSATLSGDILNLQFNTASDIWNGTPILIKTSSDITNPVFENVTIESETADHTNGGFVTFQGTFVQQVFHAGDQVLLLLANNQLAYPQQDRTLKGFRAYFEVNTPNAQQVIKRARIVTPNNTPTEINLVGVENSEMLKTIENGQLIIIRDGVRYNVMGVKLQ